MNHASIAHKIVVFKKQNKQNKKPNSMNIYFKSTLPSSHTFRNAELHHGKSHSHIILTKEIYSFCHLNVYHHQKGLLAKIHCYKLN